MNTKNKALINYYSRLIKKETYKLEDVPEDMRDQVSKVLKDDDAAKSPIIDGIKK